METETTGYKKLTAKHIVVSDDTPITNEELMLNDLKKQLQTLEEIKTVIENINKHLSKE